MPPGQLNPDEIAELGIRRRRIRERYDLTIPQIDYQEGVAKREHGRNLSTLTKKYDRLRERLPWRYAARGVLHSGIYGRGLQEYATDRNMATTQLGERLQDQASGFALARQQALRLREMGLQDINELEAARIASVASMLQDSGF